MTATRDPDRLLRAWLDLMPDEAPDRAIAAVLQAAETARQVRALPWYGPRRPLMNRLPLVFAVMALGAALVGGAILFGGGRGPVPATSAPTPAPSPIASPPTTAEPLAEFDETLLGSWVADAAPITGLTGQGPRIQATFSWDGGTEFQVQTDYVGGHSAFRSDSLSAGPGQFRLRSRANLDGCQAGDEGTYGWSRSADGLFLTLTLVGDECATRSTALARQWVRTLGGVNDGGPGMALLTDPHPDMLVTLPRLTWGMAAIPPVDIGTFVESDPDRHFLIHLNPMGLARGCDTTNRGPLSIEPTLEGLYAYLAGLPMLHDVASSALTIDGLVGAHITATSDDAFACEAGSLLLFSELPFPSSNGGTGETRMGLGEPLSLWAVVADGDLLVMAYTGEGGVPAAEEQAVIDSIRFTDGLPTP